MRHGHAWLLAGVVALGGVVGGASLLGCSSQTSSSSSRPSTGELGTGLTILSTDPATGVDAAYKDATTGHVIYMETRVGPLKPQLYRDQFPSSPQYEMDTRIVDENGFTLVLVIGGDKVIDPAWGPDMLAGESARTLDGAITDMFFKLARDAGAAFAAQAGPELKDHVYHVTNATSYVPSEHPEDIARITAKIQESIAQGVVVAHDNIQGHYLEGQNKNECLFGCAGYHTTVAGMDGYYDFTSSTWSSQSWIYACNHGDCANSSNVTADGVYSYSGYTHNSSAWVSTAYSLATIWSEEPSGAASGYTGGQGCQTNYNWDTPPGHECNDDSAFENWQINDSTSEGGGYGVTTQGSGSNFNWMDGLCKGVGCGFLDLGCCSASYSCTCGTYSGCHGDWGSPPAP
jgi:hypothetical protein